MLLMAKAAALARAGELDAAAALAGEAAAAPAAEPPPRDAAAAAGGPDLAALDPGACRERWRAAALAKDEGNAAYRCNPGLPVAVGRGCWAAVRWSNCGAGLGRGQGCTRRSMHDAPLGSARGRIAAKGRSSGAVKQSSGKDPIDRRRRSAWSRAHVRA